MKNMKVVGINRWGPNYWWKNRRLVVSQRSWQWNQRVIFIMAWIKCQRLLTTYHNWRRTLEIGDGIYGLSKQLREEQTLIWKNQSESIYGQELNATSLERIRRNRSKPNNFARCAKTRENTSSTERIEPISIKLLTSQSAWHKQNVPEGKDFGLTRSSGRSRRKISAAYAGLEVQAPKTKKNKETDPDRAGDEFQRVLLRPFERRSMGLLRMKISLWKVYIYKLVEVYKV